MCVFLAAVYANPTPDTVTVTNLMPSTAYGNVLMSIHLDAARLSDAARVTVYYSGTVECATLECAVANGVRVMARDLACDDPGATTAGECKYVKQTGLGTTPAGWPVLAAGNKFCVFVLSTSGGKAAVCGTV